MNDPTECHPKTDEFTILLDVDEVLADLHPAARLIINNIVQRDIPLAEFQEWDFEAVLDVEQRKIFQVEFGKPGLVSRLQPTEGSVQAVRGLRELGCNVVFVTTPNSNSRTWMRERWDWLIHHFDARHDDIMQVHAKHRVVGDVFVDDKPINVVRWADNHPTKQAFLWSRFYNELADKNIPRLRSWDELLEIAQHRGRPESAA